MVTEQNSINFETPRADFAYVTTIENMFTIRDKTMQPRNSKELTAPQRALLSQIREIGFGKIRNMPIIGGKPYLHQAQIVRRRKCASPNPRFKMSDEFDLSEEQIALLQAIHEIHDGVLECIEIQRGLPFQIDSIEQPR